jgi:hypothetical protein
MDRETVKKNYRTGLLIGGFAAIMFAASFFFSTFYIAG